MLPSPPAPARGRGCTRTPHLFCPPTQSKHVRAAPRPVSQQHARARTQWEDGARLLFVHAVDDRVPAQATICALPRVQLPHHDAKGEGVHGCRQLGAHLQEQNGGEGGGQTTMMTTGKMVVVVRRAIGNNDALNKAVQHDALHTTTGRNTVVLSER